MTSRVDIRTDGDLTTITLARPEVRNALDVAMLEAIAKGACCETPILLLRGEGEAFCGGFDVPLMRRDPDAVNQLIAALSTTCRSLRRSDATVLVDVQGAAVAGGCALAVSADILLAREGARLGYPVHPLGISPAVTIPLLLPAIGGGARSLLMSGRLERAESLRDQGLVHHLLPTGEPLDPVLDHLRQRGSTASAATKQWLNALDGSLLDERFDGPVEGSRGLRIRQRL